VAVSERGIYSAPAVGGLKSALRSDFGFAVLRGQRSIGDLAFTPIFGVTGGQASRR